MKRNRPLIGVTPLWDTELRSVWMLPDYLDGIREAGGVPVVLPLEADAEAIAVLAESFDGFLFTGGPDVSPSLYGVDDTQGKAKTCPPRDLLEAELLRRVVALDKPVLGICRGLQLINAVLGGTLYLDLPSEHPSELVHRQAKPYGRYTHSVRWKASSATLWEPKNFRSILSIIRPYAIWRPAWSLWLSLPAGL